MWRVKHSETVKLLTDTIRNFIYIWKHIIQNQMIEYFLIRLTDEETVAQRIYVLYLRSHNYFGEDLGPHAHLQISPFIKCMQIFK